MRRLLTRARLCINTKGSTDRDTKSPPIERAFVVQEPSPITQIHGPVAAAIRLRTIAPMPLRASNGDRVTWCARAGHYIVEPESGAAIELSEAELIDEYRRCRFHAVDTADMA